MPITSSEPSFASKCLNWLKNHPIFVAAGILAILAIAGFLTAGFIVPIVLGGVGIAAGVLAGGAALCALVGLCAVYTEEPNYSDNDNIQQNNPLGWGFTAGAILGGIGSALCPPIGLVALSLLIGAAVFGMSAGIMSLIRQKMQTHVAAKPEVPPTSTHTACHETFGSKPGIVSKPLMASAAIDNTKPVDDTASVVKPDSTVLHRINNLRRTSSSSK